MLFNSIDFAVFLPIVFLLYWLVVNKNLKFQNILLLVSSYFFYACWDYRFLFLLMFSTLLDYYTGLRIYESETVLRRRFWLWLSIGVNIGFLGFFKYYNFFVYSFVSGFSMLGIHVNTWTLQIILPVGISFYTFHGLSYVLDIYKRRIFPEKNFVDYSLFVTFFPLLVAGPIERATHLLPQIKNKRVFDSAKAVDGLRQILWGLFKKIVIADNCATLANMTFNQSSSYSGMTLLLGAVFFAFQIYGDFSGYSDIALGVARLFGVELLRNFAYPYFSRDIAEFWRRWHISLSSWFRDYLYIPLGGSNGSRWSKVRNVFIIFLVSGFWHGANWKYIAWGGLNALYILPSILFQTNRTHLNIVAQGNFFPTFREFLAMIFTFFLTVIAWIFFRADGIKHALYYIQKMVVGLTRKYTYFETFEFISLKVEYMLPILLVFFIYMEWIGREQNYAIAKVGAHWNRPLRWGFYLLIVELLFLYPGLQSNFIYFEF